MRHILLAAVLVASPTIGRADSFMPPTLTETRSPSDRAAVTVIPARLSCGSDESGCEPAARAVIDLVNGQYRMASTTVRLLNAEAPGLALVTDDGERLLTINDYGGAGFGPNVLVVYRRDGSVVRRMHIYDILPEAYVAGLPRTASTIRWWGDAPSIEPDSHMATIPINLVVPDGQEFRGRRSLPLRLNLDTGELEEPAGPVWEAALNCARASSWLVPDRKALRERERFRKLCR